VDCYQWGNQKVYCGDGAYDKALKQGQAIYQTGWREAENVSTISIEQLGVGVEFKFPQDWFEPPFTEFVLVSKEELSDDEWKIVFDPLVKKGVSNIEATIPSDTRFVLLQEMDFGYESTDDDDYLPDKFQAEYQPNQTLSDYTPEQLTESSAIEGYQPLKYSVVGNRAEGMSCPPATQDSALNRKNQESTYENHDYGPRDVTNPGDYWEKMAEFWEVSVEKAKKQNCGNCVAYDVSPRMRECGVGENLGYCWMHNFKCQSARTCNTWAKGGPIKTDKVSQEWQERAFGGTKTTSKVATKATRPQVLAADSKEEARLKKYEKTYGKEGAKVRNRIFKRILAKAQDGTKAGQWSARKAQSLAEEYEEEMGKKGKKPYKSSKRTKSQKSLKDWGDQDWRTKSGKKSSKTGERYLPAKAIKALTDEEYKKTSAKKRKDMKKGKQFSDQPKSIAKKTKKYRAESSKPSSVEISRSTNPEKKLMAIFYDDEGKKMKTTHFGQRGASDYTKHGDKERMERYLERHGGGFETSTKEDWKDPTTAGSLSRWILWNKPGLKSSFDDYKSRFGLKGSLNVSKSAESEEKVVGKRIKQRGEHKKPSYELSYKGQNVRAIYYDTTHPNLRGKGYYGFIGIPQLEGYDIADKTIGIAKARFKGWVDKYTALPPIKRLIVKKQNAESEEKKKYVLKNPDDYFAMLKEIKANPVPIDWKVKMLEKSFPHTGKTWKRSGEYPEVVVAPNYLSIKMNRQFSDYAFKNRGRGVSYYYKLPPHVKSSKNSMARGTSIYTGSEYDKGYEGKGVSYLDPAKSKQDNLSEVIETLYLDKDGERTLYTQGTPKNKEVIIPDGLQKIMDDINATEALKYMKGDSRLWLSPKIPLENLREGMVVRLDIDRFGSYAKGKVVKIEPKGEEGGIRYYDITFDRMIDENWVKSMKFKWQRQQYPGNATLPVIEKILSKIDPKEKEEYVENSRFQTKEYDERKFFTPQIEYDEQIDEYFITGTELSPIKRMIKKKQKAVAKGAEQETSFPFLQFTSAVLLVSVIPLFLDNRRDKV